MDHIYSFKKEISSTSLKKFVFFSILFLCQIFYVNAQSCSVNAGINQTICVNEVFQLDGNGSGTFVDGPTWEQISGPSVFISDPSADDPIISGATAGNTYVFRLFAECGNGETPSQTVSVSVLPITVADAGEGLESCPDSSGSLNIIGNPAGAGETGEWIISGGNASGVVIADVNSATTSITLPEGSAGSTTLSWVITGGNGCMSSDDIVITNFGGVDPVDAGPDETLTNCYTISQNYNLNGSFAGNGTNGQQGTWTFVSGPTSPTIGDENNNNTSVGPLTEGTYVFRWDVDGPCVSGDDIVTITVPPATQDVTTASTTNSDQRFCDASITETTLIGNLSEFANETVTWTQTGGPAATIVNPNQSPFHDITQTIS